MVIKVETIVSALKIRLTDGQTQRDGASLRPSDPLSLPKVGLASWLVSETVSGRQRRHRSTQNRLAERSEEWERVYSIPPSTPLWKIFGFTSGRLLAARSGLR